jgi:hypothetical protein
MSETGEPRSNGPLLASALLILGALVIAGIGGFGRGSIIGGLLALAATIPAGYALWQGTQKKTQTTTLYGMLLLLAGLAIAALLIILRIIDWLR